MERINWILKHPLYLSAYRTLEELEQDRIFCRHQLPHLLDVARIAYIRSLEQALPLSKPVIYAAAILHDIGKGEQYINKTPHELASYEIARRILSDMPKELCFTPDEQMQILSAIRNHRKPSSADTLDALLYSSDKTSRNCFACPAQKDCNWEDTKKNWTIRL